MTRRLSAVTALLLSLPVAAMAKEGGMPQLDFANPLTKSQVVWGAIIFFVLYLLLSRWALPQVASVLTERESKIAADLEAARAAKTKADSAITQVTEATQKARAEAQAAVTAAADKAKQEAAAQSAALNARLDAQLTDAESRISAARGAAMGALRQVANDTAETVIARLTGAPAPAGAVDRAVGNMLTARGIH
jgi:F-type H+-transporting ATPase subunit b